MSTVAKTFLTPEEYLARERLASFKSEFYRGETFAMAGASEQHNLIVLNVGSVLREQLKGRPCRVYPSDLRLRIPVTGLFTYPDLMVVCDEPRFEFDRRDVLTNPNVIVEVLSPTTEAYDRGVKFEQYRTLESLSQYVLIAQDRFAIDCFTRSMDGKWSLTSANEVEKTIELTSIGCSLPLVEVYDKVEWPKIDL